MNRLMRFLKTGETRKITKNKNLEKNKNKQTDDQEVRNN